MQYRPKKPAQRSPKTPRTSSQESAPESQKMDPGAPAKPKTDSSTVKLDSTVKRAPNAAGAPAEPEADRPTATTDPRAANTPTWLEADPLTATTEPNAAGAPAEPEADRPTATDPPAAVAEPPLEAPSSSPKEQGLDDQSRKEDVNTPKWVEDGISHLTKLGEKLPAPAVPQLGKQPQNRGSDTDRLQMLNQHAQEIHDFTSFKPVKLPELPASMSPSDLKRVIKKLCKRAEAEIREWQKTRDGACRLNDAANRLPLLGTALARKETLRRSAGSKLLRYTKGIARELEAQYPASLLKGVGFKPGSRLTANSADLRHDVNKLINVIGRLQAMPPPRKIEVTLSGRPQASPIDYPDIKGVDVSKSMGILIGNDGNINVFHVCNTPRPIVQISDLTEAATKGAASCPVKTLESSVSGQRLGLSLGWDSPIKAHHSSAVVQGNHAQLNLTAAHTLPNCTLSPAGLLKDNKVRQLALQLGAESATGQQASLQEREAARRELPEAITMAVKHLSPVDLILDYTDHLTAAIPKPQIQTRNGQLRVIHASGVAIGENNQVDEAVRVGEIRSPKVKG